MRKNYINKGLVWFIFLFLCCCNLACKKYLAKKPDKQLVVPTSLNDLQSLLDNNNKLNMFGWGIGENSADDYYLTLNDWSSTSDQIIRNMYIWGDEVVGDYTNVWAFIYTAIYDTNVVLDNVDNVPVNNNKMTRNNVKGSALFFRSLFFYRLVSTFALGYNEQTSKDDLGIPLRLSSNFSKKSIRSTNEETYSKILSDLLESLKLLPKFPSHVLRPSKAAAYGLLARVYLSMGKYKKAGLYADSCLLLNSKLMDFNDLDTTINYPIEKFNDETIFYSSGSTGNINNRIARIDSILYKSYANNDLRKSIYFNENSDGSHSFYGGYTGESSLFLGLATDEQYLIKAECLARAKKASEAMRVLNKLLIKRWNKGTFIPLKGNNANDALKIILMERRKELLMRDLRWQDIKRLNIEGAGISLERVLGEKKYILIANSPKFALPLPDYIIRMTGMEQNPR